MRVLTDAFLRAKNVFYAKGPIGFLRAMFRYGAILLSGLCWILGSWILRPSFQLQNQRYRYFLHLYNLTWRSERAVEIPIVRKLMEGYDEGDILEVGNVLSHYFRVQHDIVDKYEKNHGVLNQDAATFSPKHLYKLIVCISTLEHVGWDEYPRDPSKTVAAFENLLDCLSADGKMIVTVPVGQNPELDRLIAYGVIQFDQRYYMKRTSKLNSWVEADLDEVGRHANRFSPTYLMLGIKLKERSEHTRDIHKALGLTP